MSADINHNRFPIRFVRRPPPSLSPPSLEQISQPQTTLMNWRYNAIGRIQMSLIERAIAVNCKRAEHHDP
jgi:hypothetical protein